METTSNQTASKVAKTPIYVVAMCISMSACYSGCQFAPPLNKAKWAWQKNTSKPLPDRILPIWTDSVLHQPGQPGVRGFGGRVYFYGKENTEPMEVDGSFAVYVFDAEDNAPTDQKPLRKFVFTPDQFKTHMSKTSMGPSYSVWIPWGEVGGVPRKLSLIARFEGREGGTTISDPTIKLLPGIPTNTEPASSDDSKVSLANHSESVRDADKKKDTNQRDDESRGVGSIDLPPSFQRHLRSPSTNSDIKPESDRLRPSFSSSSSSRPTSEQSASLPPQENSVATSGLNASKEAVVAPITTQVIDARTRGSQRSSSSGLAKRDKDKVDIHQSKWIQSPSR